MSSTPAPLKSILVSSNGRSQMQDEISGPNARNPYAIPTIARDATSWTCSVYSNHGQHGFNRRNAEMHTKKATHRFVILDAQDPFDFEKTVPCVVACLPSRQAF